jgi:hypothetical protein
MAHNDHGFTAPVALPAQQAVQQRAFSPAAQPRAFSPVAQRPQSVQPQTRTLSAFSQAAAPRSFAGFNQATAQRSFAPVDARAQERNFAQTARQDRGAEQRAFAMHAINSNRAYQAGFNRGVYNQVPSTSVVYNPVPVQVPVPVAVNSAYNPLAYGVNPYNNVYANPYGNQLLTASYVPGSDQYDLDTEKNQLASSIQNAMMTGQIPQKEAEMLAVEITQLNTMENNDLTAHGGLTASDEATLVSYLNQIAAQFNQGMV